MCLIECRLLHLQVQLRFELLLLARHCLLHLVEQHGALLRHLLLESKLLRVQLLALLQHKLQVPTLAGLARTHLQQ